MKYNNLTKLALGLSLGLQMPALAGPVAETAPASNPGDFCTWLKNKPGTLYKNSENPWIQSFQIEGRLQYQAAYIEGRDVNGDDFNETFDEYRRFRLGAKAKFLNYFGLKYQVNLVADGRPSGDDLDWGYDSIDEAYISFDLGKAINTSFWDELSLSYGRHKYLMGYEAHASSTKLLTVERSSLANKAYGSARLTGLVAEAAKGDWNFGLGLFSGTVDTTDVDEFADWQEGQIYWASVGYKANDQWTFGADFAYNDADITEFSSPIPGDDPLIAYKWAGSLNAQYEKDRFGVIGDLIVGNNGRGDSHYSIYTGLNYYMCGHNAKIQGGIEYQEMDTPSGKFDTLTYLIGFRTYF